MICSLFLFIPLGYIFYLYVNKDENRKLHHRIYISVVVILWFLSLLCGAVITSVNNGFPAGISGRYYEMFCIASVFECLILGVFAFHHKKINNKDHIRVGLLLIYLVFPIFQIISLKIVETSHDEWQNKGIIFSVLSTFFALLGDLSIIHFLLVLPSKNSLANKKEQLKHAFATKVEGNLARENYFKDLSNGEEKYSETLELLEKYALSGDMDSARIILNEYYESTEGTEAGNFCENRYVNAIIREKAKKCEAEGIDFSTGLRCPEGLEIEPVVLCSVFGNLLDNAINACRVVAKGRKWIWISAKPQGDYLMIFVDNSADSNSQKRDRTRKHYGQQIVKEHVIIGGGQCNFKWDKKKEEYNAEVALLVKGEEK